MTITQFIERAIEGGYEPGKFRERIHLPTRRLPNRRATTTTTSASITLHEILLDPLAWKAVGKVEGWKECPADLHPELCGITHTTGAEWKMREMVHSLWRGKTIEQYLETL